MSDLAKIRQNTREAIEEFLARFKKARVKCHLNIPESEFLQLAQQNMSFEYRIKFDGMIFYDLRSLAESTIRYENMLKEESQRKHQGFKAFKIGIPRAFEDAYEID